MYGVKHLPKAKQKGFKDGNVKIPEMKDSKISLVIGNNYYGLIHPRETVYCNGNGDSYKNKRLNSL